MKKLINQYLSEQNILIENYSVTFLKFSTKLYKNENNEWFAEFPKWRFNCPKPNFTSLEVENALKEEYIEAHTDGINNKYANDEITKQAKLDELNSLTDLEEIINYNY
jgi:hypothetical protein